jgi:hypothetical protein
LAIGDHVSERHRSLLKFARKNRFSSAEHSHCVCFHATAQLGQRAAALDLENEVRFLHWRVRGDVHFREHWSLSFRSTQVLDLTAVQVDGHSNPLRRKTDYPARFGSPRDYPLGLVLRHVAKGPPPSEQRLPVSLLWRVHRSMVAYDLRRASWRWTGWPFFVAFVRLSETLAVLALSATHHWAQTRLDTLRFRLRHPLHSPLEPLQQTATNRIDKVLQPTVWGDAMGRLRTLPRAACAMFFLGVPL